MFLQHLLYFFQVSCQLEDHQQEDRLELILRLEEKDMITLYVIPEAPSFFSHPEEASFFFRANLFQKNQPRVAPISAFYLCQVFLLHWVLLTWLLRDHSKMMLLKKKNHQLLEFQQQIKILFVNLGCYYISVFKKD